MIEDKNIELHKGLVLTDKNNDEWVVLHADSKHCSMVQLNSKKTVIDVESTREVFARIYGENLLVNDDLPMIVVDRSRLSEKELARYERLSGFFVEVEKLYGPDYKELGKKSFKPELGDLASKFCISRTSMYRYIDKWLKNGLNVDALINKNIISPTNRNKEYSARPGRVGKSNIILDDTLKAHFEQGRELWMKNKIATKSDAFDVILAMHYSDIVDNKLVLWPQSERPTLKQFYNYMDTRVTKTEAEIRATSEREFANDSRPFNHTPRGKDLAPGSLLEFDAMELPFNIVSQFNKERNVGKPILYMLTDVYSHCIVAFHVGFDNNAVLGMTNCYANLIDNRKFVLELHGIEDFNLDSWPTPFLPSASLCDHGSDFVSDEHSRICMELKIRKELARPGMGSLKGLIERSFGLFMQLTAPLLYKHGLIERRHDSTHKKDAELMIEDAYAIAIRFLEWRNTTPMKHYRMSVDMVREGIEPSPIEIWNYGVARYGKPFQVNPVNQLPLLFKLMPSKRATITREGIILNNLVYQNEKPEIIAAMKNVKANANKKNPDGSIKNSMMIRYDPRSIDTLYYEKDGRVEMLDLIPERSGYVQAMTWDEYKDFDDNRKEIKKDCEDKITETRLNSRMKIEGIINNAKTGCYADASDMEKFRKLDKQESNYSNRFSLRFPTEQTDPEINHRGEGYLDLDIEDEEPVVEEETTVEEEKTVSKEETSEDKNFSPFSDEAPVIDWGDDYL